MKKFITISILLAALLPSSAIGDSLYQWKKIDKHMIDLINEGYEIMTFANTFSMIGKGIQLETYILKKKNQCVNVMTIISTARTGKMLLGARN